MKKRPSLLLEILLSCALLTAAVGPLIRKPIALYQMQMKVLKEVEKQRLADLTFAEVKMALLRHQIPWKKLPSKEKKQIVYPMPPATLNIPYCQAQPIQRRVIFKLRREKVGIQGDIVRLLDIEVQFEPFPAPKEEKPGVQYIYPAIVKKMSA